MANDINNDIFHRVNLVLGEEFVRRAGDMKVIVLGLGGVGSWCAEGLFRTGFTNMTIVDCDTVNATNINRQMPALSTTIGKKKTEVVKERLLEINGDAQVTVIDKAYTEADHADFHLADYDIIIDAIDSLTNKAALILEAASYDNKIFVSSMGAASKIDATQISIAEFWKVAGCPLAAAIRKRFKKFKTLPKHKFKCIYSPEIPYRRDEYLTEEDKSSSKQVNGSLIHITGIFGFMITNVVVNEVMKRINSVDNQSE